jgi:hypothetical protein
VKTAAVSSADGWPVYWVEVEHLPDRTMHLWLRQGEALTSLGTARGSTGLYPVVKERVATCLGLVDPDFYVELRVPRPAYVRDGDRVTVVEEDGTRTEAEVVDWIDGSVVVDLPASASGGSGVALFAPEDVLFPGDGPDR